MTTELNHVDQVLVSMLKAWPTANASRLDCLHDIATSHEYNAKWNEDGTLWVSPDKMTPNDWLKKTEDQDDDVVRYRAKSDEEGTTGVVARQMLADRLLTLRSRGLIEAFTRDNAELVIAAGNSYDPEFKAYPSPYGWANTLPRGSYQLLDSIPENADPLWIKAFIELMEEVLRFAADYAKRYQDDLDHAKTKAREVLIRLKGSDTEKVALKQAEFQKRLDALMAEAAQQGVEIKASIA
jgi:hypothetical protein